MELCSEEAGILETACLHSPGLLVYPHPTTQHMVPIDSLTLEVGRQTGWMRGDQNTGSLSFRRAMSSDMRLLKCS